MKLGNQSFLLHWQLFLLRFHQNVVVLLGKVRIQIVSGGDELVGQVVAVLLGVLRISSGGVVFNARGVLLPVLEHF